MSQSNMLFVESEFLTLTSCNSRLILIIVCVQCDYKIVFLLYQICHKLMRYMLIDAFYLGRALLGGVM